MSLNLDPATTSVVPLGERIAGMPQNVVIRQLYLGCLSLASYVVGDARSGRAIAVDPRRDVSEIIAAADAEGLKIETVVQTHFHADFLSGHLELAAATGAEIAYGSVAQTEFESRKLADGEVIDLGSADQPGVQVEVWHTPGHTPESISLVVRPEPGAEPVAVLSGDALFIGDVGRPDLLASLGASADDLGRMLYGSLERLMELPDQTLLLPAHGAGSACGKSLSTETVSTMGEQRISNYALRAVMSADTTIDQFVEMVTEDQPAAPGYFVSAAVGNRQDRPILDESAEVGLLDLDALDRVVANGAVVVDVRPPEEVARGYLKGSISVGLGGRFAEQVGSVVPVGSPVVLVGPSRSDQAHIHEAVVRLSRIGFDNVVGVLPDVEAVLASNPQRGVRLSRLTAEELESRRANLGDGLQIVDVRNPGEITSTPLDGTVGEGAVNIPLAALRSRLSELDPTRPVVAICAGGARSAIAATLLCSEGFADVSDVRGGASALGATSSCSL